MTKYNYPVSARGDRRKALSLARFQPLFAILAISLGSSAVAQTGAVGANEPQPFFYPAPPAGFNPVAASDADLATYGFPKRPPLTSTTYAAWANAMTMTKARVANPIAQATNINHRKVGGGFTPVGAAVNTTSVANTIETGQVSYNWSGVGVTGPSGYFLAIGSSVTTAFQPPSIGTENCSYAPYTVSMWAGMDGLESRSRRR
jgi:hypothetical protein